MELQSLTEGESPTGVDELKGDRQKVGTKRRPDDEHGQHSSPTKKQVH